MPLAQGWMSRAFRSESPPAEHPGRQPKVGLFARLLRSSKRSRTPASPRYMRDPGSPATAATAATAASSSATAQHSRLQVRLGRPQGGGGVAEWGMSLVDDDEHLLRQYCGVPISAVAVGSPAAAAGVAAGDVISHVAGRQVSSLQGFKALMVNALLDGAPLPLALPLALALLTDPRP